MADSPQEQLTGYLSDAHSIEEQALAQLRTAPKIAGTPKLAAAFEEHLAETEGHEQTVKALLEARPYLERADAALPAAARVHAETT